MASAEPEVIDLDEEGDGGDDEREVVDENDNEPQSEADKELFRLMKSRYGFMGEKFYELKSAKRKSATSREVTLRFQCKSCPSRISTDVSSFSNLKKHIRRLHDDSLSEYDKVWTEYKKKSRPDDGPRSKVAKKQNTMNEFFKPKSSGPDWQPLVTQSQLDRAVLHFVVDCNAPYSYVERDTFKALVLLGKIYLSSYCRVVEFKI